MVLSLKAWKNRSLSGLRLDRRSGDLFADSLLIQADRLVRAPRGVSVFLRRIIFTRWKRFGAQFDLIEEKALGAQEADPWLVPS